MLSRLKLLLAAMAIVIFVTLIVTAGNVSYISHVLRVRALMGDGSGGGHGIIRACLAFL
jgi:hypothetical protein